MNLVRDKDNELGKALLRFGFRAYLLTLESKEKGIERTTDKSDLNSKSSFTREMLYQTSLSNTDLNKKS
jgi:hypothetical protein